MENANLEIHDLVYFAHLGCTESERVLAQEIHISLFVDFGAMVPKATESDLLKDTVCYFELSRAIAEICETRQFATIEKMAFEVLKSIKVFFQSSTRVKVKVHKLRPALSRKNSGASFSLCLTI